MRKYITEFIGAFFLVLTIALTGNSLAIGAILIALVYAGGYISGGYYNPAVTIGVFLRGKLGFQDLISYIIAQIVGGALAAVVYFALIGEAFVPSPGAGVDFFEALLVEIVATFVLTYVVLHVATAEETEGNQYYGFAIGMTLFAIIAAGGAISGGVYNPAVAVGPIIINIANIISNISSLIIYILGPVVGAGLAAMAYRFISQPASPKSEEETESSDEIQDIREEEPEREREVFKLR